VGAEFINGHAVDARRAFVAFDPLQGYSEVLFVQNCGTEGKDSSFTGGKTQRSIDRRLSAALQCF
jgi:hypothetical protein